MKILDPKEMPRIWELKQSIEPNVLEMYIYGEVEGDHYNWWTGEKVKSETSADYFVEELSKYPNVTEIRLYVNSFGGYVYEAMSIRNQLKRHPAKVIGYVDGFACSAASFILTGCDEVRMYSNTMQMIHEMIDGVRGNSKQLRKAADNLDKMMVGNKKAYLEKSGGKLDEETLTNMLKGETWLTAQECFDYGLADVIIEELKDMTDAKKMIEQRNNSLEQQINYNRALVALASELNQSFEKEPDPEPKPQPMVPTEPQPALENKYKNMLKAITR